MEQRYKYNQSKYPFGQLVSSLFEVPEHEMDNLHKRLPENIQYEALFTQQTDSSTWFHKKFYEKLNSGWPEFIDTYRNLVREVVQPIMETEELIFQKTPTFRVHLPGNLAVGAFHKDSGYNHQPNEINFIIPLTEAFESNTMIVESEPGKMDFHQVEMHPGELLRFHGSQCTHGSLPNKTGKSRVSLDFRVLRPEEYDPEFDKKSMTKGIKFIVGGYYDRF